MVRFHFWSSGSMESLFRCYYSQVYSDPEWLYLLLPSMGKIDLFTFMNDYEDTFLYRMQWLLNWLRHKITWQELICCKTNQPNFVEYERDINLSRDHIYERNWEIKIKIEKTLKCLLRLDIITLSCNLLSFP